MNTFVPSLENLASNDDVKGYVDFSKDIPEPFKGSGHIRLIILGQDPTVKNEKSRQEIKQVLNLDKKQGQLYRYLANICAGLGIDIEENVYATNLYKNFFVQPPTTIKEVDIFKAFLPYWLPVLIDELAEFPGVPVLVLGQPLLRSLVCNDASPKVKYYWGFTNDWKSGTRKPFQHLKPDKNILGRLVFPFPHQPSIRKQFYRERLKDYTAYTKRFILK